MTDLTKLRAELRAGLEGVTPGPWCYDNYLATPGDMPERWFGIYEMFEDDPPILTTTLEGNAEAIAKHISRCSPDNIRALLDALDAAERERDEARLHVEMLQEKIDADKSCACSYDTVHDVCLSHSPLLDRAIKERDEARAEVERHKSDQGYIIGWNAGWDEAFSRLKFPTMLRKMWSGGEVQAWLDERRGEQTGPEPGSLSAKLAEARRERDEARAALYCRVSSKVFCAMLSTGVCDKIDKSDHEAALTRARIEGRIEGMEKAARIYEDGLDDAGNEWDVFRDAARAIRALKERAP